MHGQAASDEDMAEDSDEAVQGHASSMDEEADEDEDDDDDDDGGGGGGQGAGYDIRMETEMRMDNGKSGTSS